MESMRGLLLILLLGMVLVAPALGQQTATDWLNEGQKLVDQGRYTEAIQAYDKGIELSPQFTDLYYHKGVAFAKLGKPDEAIQAFDKVNEVNPKDGVVAYYWIGRTLSGAGRYDEAIQAYGKSTQSFNTYGEWFPGQKSICAQAWYYEGKALDAIGKSDEAQNAYDNAIKLDPSITRPNKAGTGTSGGSGTSAAST
jgi:tetratricopeptide (TPR) repeat protein